MKRMLQIGSLAIILLGLLTESGWTIPQGIVIQGVLTNAAGKPLTGARAWQIKFYDTETSGNLLGSTLSGTVTVAPSGRWSITLTPPAAVLTATGEIWYELGIDSAQPPDGSVDPGDIFAGRTQVQSVLFARRAANATMLGGQSAASFVTTSTLVTGSPAKFGDGSDGDLVIRSSIPPYVAAQTVTLTRNMYFNTLIVNGTLVTNGFMVYVAGTLTGTGTITYGTANPGGDGNDNGYRGAGGAANTTGFFKNVAGGNGGSNEDWGGNIAVNISAGHALGVAGGGGGTVEEPGGSSSVTAPAFRFGILKWNTLAGLDFDGNGIYPYVSSAGGGGGDGTIAGGGGGGAGGGIVYIVANSWAGSFTIQATGGNGGAGGYSNGVGGGPGGGGGGGGGGVSVVIYGSKSWTGTYNLAGGAAGGVGATAGNTGISYEIPFANLL